MRKLVLILIAFLAVITFIRAFDNSSRPGASAAEEIPGTIVNLDSGQ
ncbi:MAG: hypothetical protein FWH35_02355 [Treponema sp.]|nr:hypothetical protein [Treponema sp.]